MRYYDGWKETTTCSLLVIVLYGTWLDQCTKKFFITFIWGYPFITCVSYDRIFNLSHIPPSAHMYAFRKPLPFTDAILSIWYSLARFEFAFLPWFSHIVSDQKFENLRLTLGSLWDLFVANTHHFLTCHSVPIGLPEETFSLMVASNC